MSGGHGRKVRGEEGVIEVVLSVLFSVLLEDDDHDDY